MPALLVIPCLIVFWWVFVMNIAGLVSGWWALARHYTAREPFQGVWFHFCSAKLGWSNYGSILFVGVSADGLAVRVLLPFRPGHPPLFFPWAEVDDAFTKSWFADYFDVQVRQAPGVRFRFRKRLGLKVAAAANRSWGSDQTTTELTDQPRADEREGA